MKKLLTLLLTLLMIFTLVGCNSKQEETIKVDEPVQQEKVVEKEEVIVEQEEEIKEEVKEEKVEDTKDITKMKFWVVFYDQYDNELQREALKYGTVPEYKGWLPEGFDKWVYKKSGRDATLKAITGNTYYKAVCHEVSHSGGGGSNPPAPACTSTGTLFYIRDYAVTGEPDFQSSDYASEPTALLEMYEYDSILNVYNCLACTESPVDGLGIGSQDVGKFFHSDGGPFVLCNNPSSHNLEGDIDILISRSDYEAFNVNDTDENFVRVNVFPYFKPNLSFTITFSDNIIGQYTYFVDGDLVHFNKIVPTPDTGTVTIASAADPSKSTTFTIKAE